METFKQQTKAMQLYGYRPYSVNVGLDCHLGCMPALSVMTAPLRLQLWHYYISEPYLYSFTFVLRSSAV